MPIPFPSNNAIPVEDSWWEHRDRITWSARGACRSSDLTPDAWFPISPTDPKIEQAKAVCMDCPVRITCLLESLVMPGTWGIWGGWDDMQRRDALNETRRS